MKRFTILLPMVIYTTVTLAQPCLPNGIIFTTQSQIDSFQINYPNCTQIEGFVEIIGFDISNLNGLIVLTSIGDCLIINSTSLTDLTGLDNITNIGGDFAIIYNNTLSNLSGLNNLTTIGGDFILNYQVSLTSLTGLDDLVSIGNDFVLYGCHALMNLSGLENLTSIGGGTTILWNNSLVNLVGINNLNSIGDFLWISGNNLISLTGLENLTSIGGYLYLNGCGELISLTGLQSLYTIGDYFWIINCNSLTSLTGLENLTNVGGKLYLESNDALQNLDGLNNLTYIDGSIQISYNPQLTNLMGLNSVTSIGGNIKIFYNALSSLSGLDNIDAASITNLYIYNNDSLSTCAVQSICDYLISPTGTIEIHDNATGCNSQEEVEIACEVGIDKNEIFEAYVHIAPNPASDFLQIESNINGVLTIYSLNNYEIIVHPIVEYKTLINISNLPRSVYILRFQNNNSIQIRKLIKQ